MTQLRQQMIEDLQLRGLAPNTQEAYLGAVKQLALHYSIRWSPLSRHQKGLS